ncbi:MAG: 2-hydroxyacyl-CoA dehydratase [Deltaproteobacteria bacterium]|nr:2-hydroxyacyl-CoA dehydratase [Deltaproteobacteria bacterium]
MKTEHEDRLNRLLDANGEESRAEAARKWKESGKMIIGTTDANVPEEVIYAAGMLPWRLTGTRDQDLSLAHSYHADGTDVYSNHLLQSLIMGEFDFLDGVVISCEDDDIRRLWDSWKYIDKTPFVYQMYAPHTNTPPVRNAYGEAATNLKLALEQMSGVTVTDEALTNAIQVYNRWRTLLEHLYTLRKRDRPPLTGTEYLKLVTASFVMPKDEFNSELEALMPYLEEREAPVKATQPRLLVCSDKLDNPEYLEFVESLGSLIAMDDLDTGSRYFWKTTAETGDPISALADRYLTRPPCPHIMDWPQYVQQVKKWVKDYEIAGVVNFPHLFGYIRQIITPYLTEQLNKADIPIMSLIIDYPLANVGQMRTRIEAFLEVLESRKPASQTMKQ